MKVYDIRSLINGNPRKINVSPEMKLCFDAWKKSMQGKEVTELDIFYAGYILANPTVREQFTKEKREDIVIENRINYSRR